MKYLAFILFLMPSLAFAQSGGVPVGTGDCTLQGKVVGAINAGSPPKCVTGTGTNTVTTNGPLIGDGSPGNPVALPSSANVTLGTLTTIGATTAAGLTSTGPTSITGNQTNGSDQINKLCVNGVCPVTAFGAIGDCTAQGSTAGCTDNASTIQAAINAAYTIGKPVYFPPNPTGSSGVTVYYTSQPLNPKGVSLYGAPGQGIRNVLGFFGLVDIRGAVGKDVLAVGDPALGGGYVTPKPGWVIQDLGLIIDDSTDATASFTGRRPGRTCSDVQLTSSSAAISSAAQCEFNLGDVGQAVSCTDGANVVTTTISGVGAINVSGFATTATLGATWGFASHAASTCYLSVMSLPVTQNIGNCALAYDNASGTSASDSVIGSVIRNVAITTTSGARQNGSCSLLFQGNAFVYNTRIEHVVSRTQWGPAFLTPSSNNGSTTWNGAGDFITLQNDDFESNYPWLSYNGQWMHWSDVQFAFAWFGPQILEAFSTGASGSEGYPAYWAIKNIEFESVTNGSQGGWRLTGLDHNIEQAVIGNSFATPARWDATASRCTSCRAPLATVTLTGELNRLEFIDNSDPASVTDSGFKNLCATGRQSNPFDSSQPARFIACSPSSSRQSLAFAQTPEFIANGDEATPFKNLADLFIWGPDIGAGSGAPTVVVDSTSETGSYFIVPPGGLFFSHVTGQALIVGQSATLPVVPATVAHICVKMKATSGTPTQGINIQSPAGSTIASISVALNTSTYTLACTDANFTALTGDSVQFVFTSPAANIDVAWMSIAPFRSRLQTAPTTFAGAGTCNAAAQGTQYFITDDNAACTFGTIATGSAGSPVPCRMGCDGINWRAGY